MNEVTIYTLNMCPYCNQAKALLDSKGVPYAEINLDGKNEELMALKNKTGLRTVPQIFIGKEFVGGYSELSDLDQEGVLENKLQG